MRAYGMQLGDVFGHGHQCRHGTEGLSAKVHVQPGDDHAVPAHGELLAGGGEAGIEELRFVDAYDLHLGADIQDRATVFHGPGGEGAGIVADDFIDAVARIPGGFEDLDRLPGDLGAPEAADQFLGLAGKHGAADHLEPAATRGRENGFVKHAGAKITKGLPIAGDTINRGGPDVLKTDPVPCMTKIDHMDQSRARHLLLKIQSLLDPGTPLSRLEHDLAKSYILQLYEVVTEQAAGPTQPQAPVRPVTPARKEEEVKWEPVVDHHRVPPVAGAEKVAPAVIPPTAPAPEPPRPQIGEEERPDTPDPIPHVPAYTPKPEPVATPVFEVDRPGEEGDAVSKLFDPPAHSEPVAAHVTLDSIEEAIGINDRIFILQDLFGGDNALMQNTFARLNALQSFEQARSLLLSDVARRFEWAKADHQKKAIEFIRIIRRRYPPAR